MLSHLLVGTWFGACKAGMKCSNIITIEHALVNDGHILTTRKFYRVR